MATYNYFSSELIICIVSGSDGSAGRKKVIKMIETQTVPSENEYNAEALSRIGKSYFKSERGLPKDEKKAIYYTQLAADQGWAVAQVNLGYYYAEGLGGLPKDEKQAVHYYQLAADQGREDAKKALEILGQ
ncbi:MAG: sel1 repeat family protein [Lachnospiraceae bacterium]|nr:sel1 repeat family protein [Lachnospiraceae bacterium]